VVFDVDALLSRQGVASGGGHRGKFWGNTRHAQRGHAEARSVARWVFEGYASAVRDTVSRRLGPGPPVNIATLLRDFRHEQTGLMNLTYMQF